MKNLPLFPFRFSVVFFDSSVDVPPPTSQGIDVKNIVAIQQKGDVNKDQFAVELFARVANFLEHLFSFAECSAE